MQDFLYKRKQPRPGYTGQDFFGGRIKFKLYFTVRHRINLCIFCSGVFQVCFYFLCNCLIGNEFDSVCCSGESFSAEGGSSFCAFEIYSCKLCAAEEGFFANGFEILSEGDFFKALAVRESRITDFNYVFTAVNLGKACAVFKGSGTDCYFCIFREINLFEGCAAFEGKVRDSKFTCCFIFKDYRFKILTFLN